MYPPGPARCAEQAGDAPQEIVTNEKIKGGNTSSLYGLVGSHLLHLNVKYRKEKHRTITRTNAGYDNPVF